VVGTRTFGKGTFQEVIELPAGGALDLTIGEYLTSEGVSLADKGIRPDVRAEDDPETPRDEALDEALRELEHER
jgi:carboxyl-terminal processing protease